jgi:hypothetical protein
MNNPAEAQKRYSQLIAKTWSDEAFKQQLLADPTTTLRAAGIEVPANVSFRVVEDSPNVIHLVLPSKPASSELDDQDLERVSGGWDGFSCVCAYLV